MNIKETLQVNKWGLVLLIVLLGIVAITLIVISIIELVYVSDVRKGNSVRSSIDNDLTYSIVLFMLVVLLFGVLAWGIYLWRRAQNVSGSGD